MMGKRWMTTLRKLPTSKLNMPTLKANKTGYSAKRFNNSMILLNGKDVGKKTPR
jgi:hypothetical protein